MQTKVEVKKGKVLIGKETKINFHYQYLSLSYLVGRELWFTAVPYSIESQVSLGDSVTKQTWGVRQPVLVEYSACLLQAVNLIMNGIQEKNNHFGYICISI